MAASERGTIGKWNAATEGREERPHPSSAREPAPPLLFPGLVHHVSDRDQNIILL